MLCELTVDLSFWFLKNHQNQKYVFWTQVLTLHWGSIVSDRFLWHYFWQKVPNDQINYKTQTKHHANTTVHHQIICTESFFNTGRQTSLFLANGSPPFFLFHVTLANANKNRAQIFDNMKKKSSLPTLQNLFTVASFA